MVHLKIFSILYNGSSWKKRKKKTVEKRISKMAVQCFLLCPKFLVSLLQCHNLHRLAVKGDRVVYARGHGRHCNLNRPVALGEAGHYSLVHADWYLDQS